MAIKGASLSIGYIAWDTLADTGKTGDSANHSLYVLKDGALSAIAAAASEVGSASVPGLYKTQLTAANMTGDSIIFHGISGTANVSILPQTFLTDQGILATIDSNLDSVLVDTGTDGVLLATGAVTAAVVATGAIDADALSADAGTEIGTAVWVSGTRTLTQSAAGVIATVSGSAITATRGDTMIATFTSIGTLAGRQALWFAAKEFDSDTDAEAKIFIEETDGMTYFDGSAHTPVADGSIAVDAASTGAVITVGASCMATLDMFSGRYDVQYKSSASQVTTLTSGKFTVAPDQVRATS